MEFERFEDRFEKDKYYNSIEDIFKDMTEALGLPWVYFIKLFENAFETYRINIYQETGAIKLLKKTKPEYYEAVLKFDKEVRDTFKITESSLGIIPIELYNKMIALSLVMLKVAEFITSEKCEKKLKSFSDSIMFLHKAQKRFNLPADFYTSLSVIFMMEDLRIKYEYRIKSKKDKKLVKKDIKEKMDILKSFFLKKFVEIINMVYTSKERGMLKTTKKFKIKTDHVFYQVKGDMLERTYNIPFLSDDGRVLTIIFTGDKRCGKTIGWLRTIESALNQGYTVIIFGKDLRLELRWANFPIHREETTRNLYDLLIEQKQQPQGIPVKIYKRDPEYPIERDVNEFGGKAGDWNRLKGVVLFEDDLYRIIKSFSEWRSKDKRKRIVAMFNEMHGFIPAIPKKRDWEFIQHVKSLFTNIGGYRVPVIGTTQYLHLIDSNARQIDIIISSYLTNIKDRRAVGDILGDKRISEWLGDQTLKQKHYFWMFKSQKSEKIKFLIPGCMPESSTENTLDEMFEKVSQNDENMLEKTKKIADSRSDVSIDSS